MEEDSTRRRVVLKLSGEALGGEAGVGIAPHVLTGLAAEVASAAADVELALVIGGGNLVRGTALAGASLDRVTADQMGMLATIVNALAFRDALLGQGVAAEILSSHAIASVAEGYSAAAARRQLAAGTVVLLAGGTGNPLFTTDTAACLRGIELGADLVVKATKVDGVYSADSHHQPRRQALQGAQLRNGVGEAAAGNGSHRHHAVRRARTARSGVRHRPPWHVDEGGWRCQGWHPHRWPPQPMIEEIKQDAAERMDKSLQALGVAFSRIRTGRANPAILDGVEVDYYGSSTPLKQVASITVEDARSLLISPWEKRLVPAIEKAILKSDLGLTPASTSDIVRLPLPPLTEQNRRDLIRQARQETENTRVAIRNIRREAIADLRELVREKEATEDDGRRSEDDMQKLTDSHIKRADATLAEKETDLLEI